MSELSAFLTGLSFGEFIVIWILSILSVFFPVLILYNLIRIRNDIKFLKINVNRILDLLDEEEKIIQHKNKNIADTREKTLSIKTKIINLLKRSSRPMSYSEIAKNLSKDSVEYDFEHILSTLEQLKSEGKIVNRLSGGKLYFRIHK